jgi:hypothetical protein
LVNKEKALMNSSIGFYYRGELISEEGAETVQIIIGIVVFVIFGLTVFGMVTNTAGIKASQIANCVTNYEQAERWWEDNDYTSVDRCHDGYAGTPPPHVSYND